MSELGPEAQTLITQFKEATQRTPEERAAMRAAIATKIAAPAPVDPSQAPVAPAGPSFTVAWIGLATFVLVALGGVYAVTQSRTASPRAIASAKVPAIAIEAPQPSSASSATPIERTAPTPTVDAPVATAARTRETPRELPPQDAASTLRDELAVLREANAAVREGRFGTALALLNRFSATHEGGTMGEERAATRVVARCGQRTDERTQREANRFLAAFPRSPQAARIRRACGL